MKMTLPPMARLRRIHESIRASEFSQRIQARQGRDRPDSAETASGAEEEAEGGAEATAALKRALDTEAAAARRQALSAQVPVLRCAWRFLQMWNALPGNVGVSIQAG
jgi:hypothetical protein